MKRDKRIEVRVTPEELTLIDRAAECSGITRAAWIRFILLGQAIVAIKSHNLPAKQQ